MLVLLVFAQTTTVAVPALSPFRYRVLLFIEAETIPEFELLDKYMLLKVSRVFIPIVCPIKTEALVCLNTLVP